MCIRDRASLLNISHCPPYSKITAHSDYDIIRINKTLIEYIKIDVDRLKLTAFNNYNNIIDNQFAFHCNKCNIHFSVIKLATKTIVDRSYALCCEICSQTKSMSHTQLSTLCVCVCVLLLRARSFTREVKIQSGTVYFRVQT